MNFQAKCTSLHTNQRVSKHAWGLTSCPIAGFKHTNSLIRRWTAAACTAAIILPNSASRHYTTTDSPATTVECPSYCKNCSSVQGDPEKPMFPSTAQTTVWSLKTNIDCTPVPLISKGKTKQNSSGSRKFERWVKRGRLNRHGFTMTNNYNVSCLRVHAHSCWRT